MTRVLLFTGKGGVGKTSIAAATAVRAAAGGRRVLVTSTDAAHSLADVLDHPVGDTPTAVGPTGTATTAGRLLALQIDAQARLERHWREVRDYLAALVTRTGMSDVEAEELVLLPGMDELFALIDLNQQVASGDHDLVVVDCAPTGETLRLLSLPDAMRWYVERIVGPGRRVARVVRPLTRGLGPAPGSPVPDDDVFGAVERVHRQLSDVYALLQDPLRTSLRLVVNPERMVVAESQRLATSLSLFGYAVDAVVVNRLLPDVVTDPYLARWKQRQADHLDVVRRSFAPTPVLTASLLDDEPAGVSSLGDLADDLYGRHDETDVLHDTRPIQVRAEGDDHVLRVALPFATKDDLDLSRRGPDLHVTVGGVRRTVPLPARLRRDRVAGAGLVDGWLEVRFVPAPEAAVTGT